MKSNATFGTGPIQPIIYPAISAVDPGWAGPYDLPIFAERSPHQPPKASSVTLLGILKLVVNTAFRFAYPFLPAIGRGLGIGIERAGVLLSVRWAAGLVSPTLIGVAGSRARSRRVMVTGLLAFTVGSILTALTGVFWGAIVGFAVLGFSKPLLDIGAQTYLSARVPYSKRARYLGVLEVAWAGGLLVGGPFAGWLIERWGWRAPFWVLGSLALVGAGVTTLTLDQKDEVPAGGDGAATARVGQRILTFLSAVILIGFGHESLLVILGGWLEQAFGLTLLALGGVGTLLGVAELIGEGTMVTFTDRIGKARSMTIGLAIATGGTVALSMVSSAFAPAIAALALTMAALEFGYIAGIPLASELRPHMRARVLGWFMVATGTGRIVADLLTPRLFVQGGMPVVTRTAAACFLVAALLISRVRE